jgi:hypothetical protein
MRTNQKKHRQFQQQLFEYFSRKDNGVEPNEIVTTEETDKGLSFTYVSDHRRIIHRYESSSNTDFDADTLIDTFIQLLGKS